MTFRFLAWWGGAVVLLSLALSFLTWLRRRRGEDLDEHDHWTCRDCGTANYGDDCTFCGGPAPWRRP